MLSARGSQESRGSQFGNRCYTVYYYIDSIAMLWSIATLEIYFTDLVQ